MTFVGVGDLHIDVWDKNNNNYKYIENTFYHLKNYIQEKQPEYLIIFGDLFHTKTTTSTEGLLNIANIIHDLSSLCKIIIIVGNHDIASASNAELNLPNIFKNTINIKVVDNYYSLKDDYGCYHFLGYFKDDILKEKINNIENKYNEEYLFGHFGINGYIMNDYEFDGEIKHFKDYHSKIKPSFLKKFKHVYLGHYHLFQRDNNITYVGSPVQQRHGEEFSDHGFIYVDTSNDIFEFRNNEEFSHKHITIKFNKENLPIIKKIKKEGGYKIRLIVSDKLSHDKLLKLKYDLLKNNIQVDYIFEESDNHEISVVEGWDTFIKQDTESILKEFVNKNKDYFQKNNIDEKKMIDLILN